MCKAFKRKLAYPVFVLLCLLTFCKIVTGYFLGNLNLCSLYREIVDKRVLVVLLVYNKNANKKTLVIPSSNIN